MKRIKIKHTDLEIAPINFGGNVFGWTLDEKQSFAILDKFLGAGFNFIDTADTYAWWINGTGGQSEEIIGKWLKNRGNRNQVVIATKVGSETKEHGFDISRKHILQSAEDSLRRLGVDHIDLYYTHFDDNVTPPEETLSAYDELIRAGKIRYVAASNISPERLETSLEIAKANDLPRYVALQPHYNLMERTGFEIDYAPLADKFDLSVFPYWSLASGFLTGKYRNTDDLNKSSRGGSAKKYLNEKGSAVLAALDTISQKRSSSPATIALAWLLAKPLITAPIVSATSESQLETLFQAPELKLDAEEVALLDKVSE